MTSTSGRGTRTPALAILVNGASSSGKSTLCRALHDRLTDLADGDPEAAFARVAYDDLGVLIPDRLFPISFVKMQNEADLTRLASRVPFDGRASWEYVDDSHAEGKHGGSPRTRVVFNSHGERLLKGLHRSWGAHLQLGTHLVIDHFLQSHGDFGQGLGRRIHADADRFGVLATPQRTTRRADRCPPAACWLL